MWITSLVNKPSLIVRSLGSEHSECAAWLHPRVCGEGLPVDGCDSRGKVFLDQCRPSFEGSLTRWPGFLMDLLSWRQLIWCPSILPSFSPAFLSPWLPGFQCYHGVSWTGSRRPVSPGIYGWCPSLSLVYSSQVSVFHWFSDAHCLYLHISETGLHLKSVVDPNLLGFFLS